MEMDERVFERARRARDARFDGRFFIGVITTGIYCRPVCPVASPKPVNVRYFPSAAAAAQAGFRPCLRCRPESSPGTPAWLGSSATVSRALKLIAGGSLDTGSVEDLAERLGIGSRHMRRLFLHYLGATPVAVAQTRRLHFAKKLIDETALPMTQVAFAAGFSSIRRFNATFQALYGRSPRELRRIGPQAGGAGAPNEYRFRLAFRPPYDWQALLAFLSPRLTPGVEAVSGNSYWRTISVDGESGFLEACPAKGMPCLELQVHFPDPRALLQILERARRMFDLGADPTEIAGHLRHDRLLAKAVARRPGLRVPGAWDGFELAVRAVLGQQVTVKGATTLAGRLAEEFGERAEHGLLFPPAEVLAEADYGRIGLTQARAQTLRELARALCHGTISFEGARGLESFVEEFSAIPGIGEWTAQYVAMRALGEPDAFPASDLGLLRAVNGSAGLVTAKALGKRAEAWRPWRAYAAMHLWMASADAESDGCREHRLPSGRRPPDGVQNTPVAAPQTPSGVRGLQERGRRLPDQCRIVFDQTTATKGSPTATRDAALGPRASRPHQVEQTRNFYFTSSWRARRPRSQGRAGVAWPAVNRWTASKRGIIGGKSQLRTERPANERFE
jgi:AraC family transcriptional regulator of adaptative response / DNA-3-methyladenine glycosylase II